VQIRHDPQVQAGKQIGVYQDLLGVSRP